MPQEQTPSFSIEQPNVTESEPTEERAVERPAEIASEPAPVAQATVQTVAQPTKMAAAIDPVQKEVETVLIENIGDIYKQLTGSTKQRFKQRGEEIALTITNMLRGGVMHIKTVLSLIRDWLAMIPGVNSFFLEQESKIKADKLQTIFNREHAVAV